MNTDTVSWLNRLAALLALTLISGCGGGSAGGEPAATSPLGLDAARSVSQTVGRAGGTLITAGADGTVYTLTVPPRALRSDASITLSPIAAIGDLPAGVSFAGGAHLTPEGQTFDVPVTLTVALPAPPPSAPIPFTYAAMLSERRLYPAVLIGRLLVFEIVHFSGYAALLAQPDIDLVHDANSYLPAPGAAGDQALQALVDAASEPPGEARGAAMRAALRGWLDNVITPAVVSTQSVTTIDVNPGAVNPVALEATSRLRGEMLMFNVALKYAVLVGAGDIDALYLDFRIAVKDAARHVIPLFNAACSQFPVAWAFAVPEVLAWQEIASDSGAAGLDPTLKRATVIDELCLQVAYEPDGGIDFPTGIQPGQSGTLSVRAGYTINGGPVRFDLPLFVLLTGASNVSPGGLQAPLAPLTGASVQQPFLWQHATTEMRIEVEACLADELLREVCQQGFVVRGESEAPFGCQESSVTVGEETLTRRTSVTLAAYNVGEAFANSSFGGAGAFGGSSARASSVAFYKVDAPGVPGSFQAVVRYRAGLRDGNPDFLPDGSASVDLTWPGGTQTHTEFGTFDRTHPITVQHGDVVKLEGRATVTSAGEGVVVFADYSIDLDPLPAGARLIEANCE
jgi:hypothetical protein